MSEQNKQIARRFLAAFAAADTAVLDQLVTDDIVDHTPSPGQAGGKQGLLAAVGRITNSWHVEDIAGMLRQLGAMPG